MWRLVITCTVLLVAAFDTASCRNWEDARAFIEEEQDRWRSPNAADGSFPMSESDAKTLAFQRRAAIEDFFQENMCHRQAIRTAADAARRKGLDAKERRRSLPDWRNPTESERACFQEEMAAAAKLEPDGVENVLPWQPAGSPRARGFVLDRSRATSNDRDGLHDTAEVPADVTLDDAAVTASVEVALAAAPVAGNTTAAPTTPAPWTLPPWWPTGSPKTPAPSSSCYYPCMLQHGCQCDHTEVSFDDRDFQFYGTCKKCDDHWGGWDCGNLVSKCLNGGNFTPGVGCNCTEQWTGTDCGQLVCQHTENNKPLNLTTNICPKCAKGWDGLECDVCDDTIRCPNGRSCNNTLVGAGNSLNMRCDLDDPGLVLALANNRPGCKGKVKMTCDKPTGWENTTGYDGTCHVSLWRVEPNDEFMDPFFYCTLSECAMNLKQQYTKPAHSRVPHLAEPIRLAARIILYVCCNVIALLAIVPLGVVRRLRSWVFIPTSVILVIVLLFYIIFSTTYGHTVTTAAELRTVVSYDCKFATCNCAPAPKNISYYPSCNTSMAAGFLRNVETSGVVQCDIKTGDCTFAQEQIPIVFPIKCSASTCDPPNGVNVAGASEDVSNPAGWGALGGVIGFFVAVAAVHFAWSLSRSRSMARVFRSRYSNQPDDLDEAAGAPPPLPAPGTTEPRPGGGGLADSLIRQPTAVAVRESETVLDIHVESYKVLTDLPFTPLRRKQDAEAAKARRLQEIAAEIDGGYAAAEESPEAAAVLEKERLAGSVAGGPDTASGAAAAREDDDQVTEQFVLAARAKRDSALAAQRVSLYDTPQQSFTSRSNAGGGSGSTGYKQILKDVRLSARSGEAIAIIGSSGAGKTTLLDIIAQHDKTGVIEGSLDLNGRSVVSDNRWCYRRSVGFVAQEDMLLPSLTVRQTIRHAARLKLPAPVEDEVLDRKVEDMLKTLHLTLCADSIVGGGGAARGISGGERRRVSIAMELIANPRLLLLDEPTSGLDSVNAHVVMRTVVDMARANKSEDDYHRFFAYKPIVIFSIHQPSTDIFRLFDKLIVLSRGRVLYNGPANTAVAHTAAILGMGETLQAETHRNPSELILEMHHYATPRELQLLRDNPTPSQTAPYEPHSPGNPLHEQLLQWNGTGAAAATTDERPMELRQSSGRRDVKPVNASVSDPAFSRSASTPTRPTTTGTATGDGLDDVLAMAAEGYKYCPNVWEQFFVLCQRTSDSLMGSYYLIACHAEAAMILGVVFSHLYRNEPLTLAGTEDKAGMITGMLLIIAFSSLSCLDLFMAEKRLAASERANGYYSTLPYFVSKVLFDYIPLRIVPVAMLAAVVYFPMGLREDIGGPFLWFVLIAVLFSCMVCGMCLAVGMVAPSFGSAALFSALLILWDATFGGLMINASTIPDGFKPFKFISPFYFAFEAMMINELDGLSCTIEPLNSAGISDNEPIPIPCRQFLYYLGLNPKHFNRDVALLSAWVVGMLVIAGTLLAFFVRHRR